MCAVLTAEQMQVYGDALAALRARQASAERLEVQLRQERLAVQAIDQERARLGVQAKWPGHVDAHKVIPVQ